MIFNTAINGGEIIFPFKMPTYTGDYTIHGNEAKGYIKLLSGGTLTLSKAVYDLCLIGKGGNGSTGADSASDALTGYSPYLEGDGYGSDPNDNGTYQYYSAGSGGGGGGMSNAFAVDLSGNYIVTIAGVGTDSATRITHENFGDVLEAFNGNAGSFQVQTDAYGYKTGGYIGGGSGIDVNTNQYGGSGGDAANSYGSTGKGGKGSAGMYAFDDSSFDGYLYAAGGGGGGINGNNGGQGGTSCGGIGGKCTGTSSSDRTSGTNGLANTGGGGGGAGTYIQYSSFNNSGVGKGGSGVAIIRWGYSVDE